jgi:hypothetical protein
VEEELPVQVVVFLVKQVLWVKVETEEPRHMVLEEVVVDTMEVAQVCRVVEGVTAAAAADLLMLIKRLHQPLPIREETTTPTVIVQLLGPVQDVALHCFQSQ